MDYDVGPIKAIQQLADDLCRPFMRLDIGPDKITSCFLFWRGTGRDDDGSATAQKAMGDRLPAPFVPAVTRIRVPLNPRSSRAGLNDGTSLQFSPTGREFILSAKCLTFTFD
jgi:hypothetical protein